jgi:hypothetical protein
MYFKALLTTEGTRGLVSEFSIRGMNTGHEAILGLRDSITFHSWKTEGNIAEAFVLG